MPASSSCLPVPVVHLVAVTVALVDDLFVAVDGARARARQQPGRPRAEAHRAAHVDDVALLVHEVDHRVRRAGVELARVGAGQAAHVARELDHRALQAEAQAEVRHVVLARVAGGRDLALDAADAEAAGHDDAVEVVRAALGEQPFGVVGRDPVDHDASRRSA